MSNVGGARLQTPGGVAKVIYMDAATLKQLQQQQQQQQQQRGPGTVIQQVPAGQVQRVHTIQTSAGPRQVQIIQQKPSGQQQVATTSAASQPHAVIQRVIQLPASQAISQTVTQTVTQTATHAVSQPGIQQLPVSQQQQQQVLAPVEPEPQDDGPEINIDINNVVCSFSVRCHLNLKKIAMEGINVVYKRENGMVNMKLRNPQSTATIWSSGKITITGATSEDASKIAARKISRCLQKLGFRVRFCKFRVVNVLGTCAFPWGIRINSFSNDHRQNASYEPELHPGVTYKIKEPKATLKIFSTGSITVTAPRVQNVELAIQHIYPLVEPYQMEKTGADKKTLKYVEDFIVGGKRPPRPPPRPYKRAKLDESSEDEESDFDDEDFDSEEYESDE